MFAVADGAFSGCVPVGTGERCATTMISESELIAVLETVLFGAAGGDESITIDTPLMGAMPEFDSMAVVSILTLLEDDHDIVVADDELDGSVFETARTLYEFLASQD